MAISLTRLSGGNTPADGSDPRTFPAIWNSSASSLENVSSDLDALELLVGDNDVSSLSDTDIGVEANGQSLYYNGSNWINGIPPILENAEQNSSYTLTISDAGNIVSMNASVPTTVTVPNNATVDFPIGTIIGVYNQSAESVTIQGAAGVTVRNDGTLAQYEEASLRKRGTNEWVATGI